MADMEKIQIHRRRRSDAMFRLKRGEEPIRVEVMDYVLVDYGSSIGFLDSTNYNWLYSCR
jgi:hypothetical protein